MQSEFYDVKARKKINAEVQEKVTYGSGGRKRYALRGKTADGRNLTKFISEENWKKTDVKEGNA